MVANKSYFVGCDFGTESCRCGIFDATGSIVGQSSSPYFTYYPSPGWCEQVPSDWWIAIRIAMNSAIDDAKKRINDFNINNIVFIRCDTIARSVVCLDKEINLF